MINGDLEVKTQIKFQEIAEGDCNFECKLL